MAVTNVPASSLDSTGDLLNWLISELVTNYRFTVYFQKGDGLAGNGNILAILERPQGETFHNDAPMTLYLSNISSDTTVADDTGGSMAGGIHLNMAGIAADDFMLTGDTGNVTVDFVNDAGSQEIRITSGDFTNWGTGGFTVGNFVRVSSAATAANNGVYEIQAISTTTFTNDSLEILEVSAGGPKDINTFDTGDAIFVEEVKNPNGPSGFVGTSGFMNAPRSDDLWEPTSMSQTSATAPYAGCKLITSPDANSATPAQPLQFILVLETGTGFYRQMGFGEVVKLVPFTGGHWFHGSIWDATTDLGVGVNHAAFVQGNVASTWLINVVAANPGGIFATDYHDGGAPSNANGRGWMRFGAYGQVSIDAPTHYNAAIYPAWNGAGGYNVGFSPSAFSGQSEAYPLTIFGTYNTNNYGTTPAQHAPMAIIPDIFLADITNVDAGSVFQDSVGDKFLVVPFYTKLGSGNGSSEGLGLLIRNPDLVVT